MNDPAGSTADVATDFHLDAPSFARNFDEVVSDLHARCPVVHSEGQGGYWVAAGFDDVRDIAQNWEVWTTTHGYEPNREVTDADRLIPLEVDPPYQTRWRSKLGPHFSPRAIRSCQPKIREMAHELVDAFVENGSCEFIDEYAAKLPGTVFFGALLGVPLQDLPYLHKAADSAVRGPKEDQPAEWGKLAAYLDGYLREREKSEPRGDFVDAVLEGVDGEDGLPVTWADKVMVMVDLLSGGLATTTYLLAGVAQFLATDPTARRRLQNDPALHEGAVEEFARIYASILAIGRTASRDTEIAGQPIKKGEMVMLSWAAAARDPHQFSNPNEIDIDRKIPMNIAFGSGPHRCIGIHLARLQALTTLEVLLERIPDLSLGEGDAPTMTHSLITRDMDRLSLRFTPGSRHHEAAEVLDQHNPF